MVIKDLFGFCAAVFGKGTMISVRRLGLLLGLALLGSCGGGGGGGGVNASGNGGGSSAIYPRFAYVADFNSVGAVSIYAVNAASGQLRHDGYTVPGTSRPPSLSIPRGTSRTW